MAAAGKERLNLKICIDNVNELSDDQQSDARMSSATDDEESSGASSDTNIESKSLVATPGDNKDGLVRRTLPVGRPSALSQMKTGPDVERLYRSLGVSESSAMRSERGLRLDTVHLRGVNEMNTDDIVKYFRDFPPSALEWIDDASCNAVWKDKLGAAKALLEVSSECTASTRQRSTTRGKNGSVEDADHFDLMAAGDASSAKTDADTLPMPPGRWRVGQPHPKVTSLYLRFATKADKKLQGTDGRNPRHLVSQTRKRKIQADKMQDEAYELTGKVHKSSAKLADDEIPFYHSRWYNETEAEFDEGGGSVFDRQLRDVKNAQQRLKRMETSDASSDGADMEAEVAELLAEPQEAPPKRIMRMHADDIEDEKRNKKSIFPRLDARNRIVGRQREKLASRSDLHDDTVRRWVTHDDGVTLRGGEVSPRRGEVTPRGGDLRARLGKRRDERAWD